MQIREYQRWLEAYDRARGWEKVHPSQTLVHAMEELGEVARLVLALEGYREGDEDEAREALAEELADCITFLIKLAFQYSIDVEDALLSNQVKAEARTSVEQGREEIERYLARQEGNLRRLKGEP